MDRAGPILRLVAVAASLFLISAPPSPLIASALGSSPSNAPPTITPIPDQVVLEGWSIAYQVMASDPESDPLTYSVTGPSWTTISGTGLLTIAPPGGTADPGGSVVSATVAVSDGLATATDSFDTRVLDARADQAEHGGVPYWQASGDLSSIVGEGNVHHGPLDLLYTDVPQPMWIDPMWGQQANYPGSAGNGQQLFFGRFYSSLLERDQVTHGHLGPNWLGTYDWRLEVNGPIADVTTNRGGKIRFQSPGPAAWTLVAPADVPHRLAENGSDFLFFDATTRWVQRFDAATGALESVEDTHGNVLTMGYAGSLLTSVTDAFGRTLSFTYDRSGRLTQVSDGTRSVFYTYSPAGELATFTDAAGGVTQYVYAGGSPAGRLTQVIEPAGNTPWTFSYGPNAEAVSIVDAGANTFGLSYTRDPSGRVTAVQVVRPIPGGLTFRNDLEGRCFEVVDPAGGVMSRMFDAQGRMTSLTRPAGDMTTFGYHASGWLGSIGYPDATTIGFSYASRLHDGLTLFELGSVARPDGTTESYSYDVAGNLTSLTDPGPFTWSWTYNSFGRPLTFTNPAGGNTTYAYDSQGRLQTLTNHFGNATTYAYDALDRLIQVTEPAAPPRTYTYDALDRLLTATNEIGKTWGYEYDSNGRLLKITDPLTGQHRLTWNAMNRLSQSETPLGGQTSYTYDALGRLTAVADPTARTTTYEYDDVARIARVRDPGGNATTYTYDSNGRIIQRANPLSNATHYTYDAVDRLTTLVDPVSTTFSFTYDAMDRLQTVAGPLGFLRDYDYDSRGLLIRSALGSVDEQYTRTALGQIGSIRDANGNIWSYGYDQEGRPVSSSDPLARTIGCAYDTRSRLSQVTTPVGSMTLSHDAASRLTQRSYSDGTVIPYAYDDVGRLLSTQGASFTYDADDRIVTSAGGVQYGYDAAGRVTALTYAPGKTVSYTYDTRGNLSQVADWIGGTTNLTYDAAGRRTRIARPDGSVASYVYDAADRLLQLADIRTDSTATVAVGYDALGRPVAVTRTTPLHPTFKNETASYAYDAAGQITGYTYDGLGRLLSDGTRSYEWDLASRLKVATTPAGSMRFEYDGLGFVTRRTLGAEVEDDVHAHTPAGIPRVDHITQFDHGPLHGTGHGWFRAKPHVSLAPGDGWYHYKPHVAPTLLVRSSSPLVNYVCTPSGELLHSVDDVSGARRFHHYDERGNTSFLSNDAGSVVTAYGYSVSGSSVDEIGMGDPHLGRFTYGAQFGTQEESGIGLVYRGADGGNIYDGRTARLLSPPPGPHGEQGGVVAWHVIPPWKAPPANGTQLFFTGKLKPGLHGAADRWRPDILKLMNAGLGEGGDVWAIFARNWGNQGVGDWWPADIADKAGPPGSASTTTPLSGHVNWYPDHSPLGFGTINPGPVQAGRSTDGVWLRVYLPDPVGNLVPQSPLGLVGTRPETPYAPYVPTLAIAKNIVVSPLGFSSLGPGPARRIKSWILTQTAPRYVPAW